MPGAWHELGPFTVFDLETTGMNPRFDRIVEMAAIHVDVDGCETRFQSLVNPGCPIPWAATNVHHITNEMVADAPKFHEIAPKFLELAHGSVLVAHNARFDLGFLQESLARCGNQPWNGKTMDTVRLARTTFAGLPSYSLQNLRISLNLPDPPGLDPHRAGADVEWTVFLLRRILETLLQRQAPSARG